MTGGAITLKRFFEIPISKKQIPNKFQASITNDQNDYIWDSNFAHWNLFVIWYLPACR